jgi:hypothetical protein
LQAYRLSCRLHRSQARVPGAAGLPASAVAASIGKMTAQPADPALEATRRAEAAESRAEELLDVLEDTGVITGMSEEQLQRFLGVVLPERGSGEKTLTTDEVRQSLGLPR